MKKDEYTKTTVSRYDKLSSIYPTKKPKNGVLERYTDPVRQVSSIVLLLTTVNKVSPSKTRYWTNRKLKNVISLTN